MATTTVIYAASYPRVAAAESDYDAVIELHRDLPLSDYYDVALVSRSSDETIRVLRKHESAEGVEALEGGGIGLATGLVLAIFPAIALTGALVVGTTAAGAAIGAITGHLSKGVSRSDLREVARVLEEGEAGLVVIAGVDVAKRLEGAIVSADRVVRKEVMADRIDLQRALRDVGVTS